METRIPARLTPEERRRFGLLVGGAFLLLAGVSHWRGHHIAPILLGILGACLVSAALLIPGYLGPVYRGWMAFGLALSKITTPIFMGLIYFVLFTLIGLVRRTLGRNALVRPAGDTFWITRHPEASRRSNLHRQF